MTTGVELDGVSAAWDLDDLQPSDDKGDRVSGAVFAQTTSSESAATPAETPPAATGEPVPVDVGSGAPVQPGTSGSAPATDAPLVYAADASNVVRLPAAISIENIRVEGSDLVLEQADGTLITIKDAAANVPTFIIGDVELPRVALLAALEASGVDVAFGADGSIAASPGSNLPNSSGGNFEVPPGGIGDGFPLTDLLPPTALAFPQYEGKELYPSLRDEGEDTFPTIEILGDALFVDEKGLPVRNLESPGSGEAADGDGTDNDDPSESTSGSFNIVSGNGIGSLVVDGVNVTNGGTVLGQYGDLVVTGTPSGVGHARKPPVWMKHGDTIEIEVEKVGILRNPIEDEK